MHRQRPCGRGRRLRADPDTHSPALLGPTAQNPDEALEIYRAHVKDCHRCSWLGGPRCEKGHALRRVYHALWAAALEAGTLDRDLGRCPAGEQPEPAQVEEDPPTEDWLQYTDPDEFLEDLDEDWPDDPAEGRGGPR